MFTLYDNFTLLLIIPVIHIWWFISSNLSVFHVSEAEYHILVDI